MAIDHQQARAIALRVLETLDPLGEDFAGAIYQAMRPKIMRWLTEHPDQAIEHAQRIHADLWQLLRDVSGGKLP